MLKVLIADKMSPRAEVEFRERGIEVDVKTGMSGDELKACIGDYDGIAVRSAAKVTADVLSAAQRLKVIGRAGIGVDNIDCAAATAHGAVVMNTPLGNAITTAEHAIALMFALAREIPAANESTRAGKWEKSRFLGVELTGKTLGIIGCGTIGSIVADRALGLKMKLVAYDPYLSLERAEDLGVEKVEFDELLGRADFISIHTPLTDATRGLIDKAAIAKMKKRVRIINCARGGIIIEEDLKQALELGHVAGAALDVYVEEPARDNPLFGMDHLVATPHLGASTSEAQENVAVQIAQQMSDYLLDGVVVNALNLPSVSVEELPRLRPYMRLAGELGRFAGQLTETGLCKVIIEYEGQAAELNTKPLTAVALEGLLAPMMETVNMVNAPLIARERDIEVSEVRNERSGDYQSMIRLTVVTERGEREVAGTVFGGNKPRIVEINNMPIEAELGPYMLFVRNQDRPGFIGRLGTMLSEHGVNIATFHLGRTGAGGDAIALIQVDEPITPEVIEQVRAIPLVMQAKALCF
jgi:D-3-phosphoglycerate dehydrogenase